MTNKCLYCEKEINYNKKYCGLKCYHNYLKKNKKQIKHICLYCNKKFISKRENCIYCSKQCVDLARTYKYELKYCKYCNKQLNKRQTLYCSKKCCGLHKIKYIIKEFKCNYCDKILKDKYEHKYCSHECYSKSILKLRICTYCNKEYTLKDFNNKKYCSSECQNNNFNKAIIIPKICKYCKIAFNTDSSHKNQQFCSQKCANKYKTKNILYHNICHKCNKKFASKYKNRKYCSNQCSNQKTKYGLQCLYNNIKLRSTYELRTCVILDLLISKNKILKWEYEVDKYEYLDENNKIRTYIIDFKIYLHDKSFYYIEVKGNFVNRDKLKIDKIKSLGYKIELWNLSMIEDYEKILNINNKTIQQLISDSVIN